MRSSSTGLLETFTWVNFLWKSNWMATLTPAGKVHSSHSTSSHICICRPFPPTPWLHIQPYLIPHFQARPTCRWERASSHSRLPHMDTPWVPNLAISPNFLMFLVLSLLFLGQKKRWWSVHGVKKNNKWLSQKHPPISLHLKETSRFERDSVWEQLGTVPWTLWAFNKA